MPEELDKDYIKYLRDAGKGEDAIFLYLDYICEEIDKLKEAVGITEPEENKDLIGAYRIQPQGGGGAKKGPPPIII